MIIIFTASPLNGSASSRTLAIGTIFISVNTDLWKFLHPYRWNNLSRKTLEMRFATVFERRWPQFLLFIFSSALISLHYLWDVRVTSFSNDTLSCRQRIKFVSACRVVLFFGTARYFRLLKKQNFLPQSSKKWAVFPLGLLCMQLSIHVAKVSMMLAFVCYLLSVFRSIVLSNVFTQFPKLALNASKLSTRCNDSPLLLSRICNFESLKAEQ